MSPSKGKWLYSWGGGCLTEIYVPHALKPSFFSLQELKLKLKFSFKIKN